MVRLSCLLSSLVLASISASASPKIDVDKTTFDCGVIAEGKTDKLHAQFTVKNTGDAPLKIDNVRPGCGCTVVKFDSTILRRENRHRHPVNRQHREFPFRSDFEVRDGPIERIEQTFDATDHYRRDKAHHRSFRTVSQPQGAAAAHHCSGVREEGPSCFRSIHEGATGIRLLHAFVANRNARAGRFQAVIHRFDAARRFARVQARTYRTGSYRAAVRAVRDKNKPSGQAGNSGKRRDREITCTRWGGKTCGVLSW